MHFVAIGHRPVPLGKVADCVNGRDVSVYAPGFIFATALPPAICAAATAAIRHLKTSSWERERHQERAARVKAMLDAGGCGRVATHH
jgi:7-keto-8-aminopelargonate synthetase-like enzyme